MREPKRYVSKAGKVSWKVRYRSFDDRERSETFYDQALAREFSGVMNAVGPARALEWLDNLDGTDQHGQALTVDDLFEKWIDWKGALNKHGAVFRVRSDRTIKDYRRDYRNRIKPTFGSVPANLVPAADVQDWIDQLGTQVEPKTIAGYHALLHGIYIWGMHPSRGLVINDPCTDTELPKRRKKKPKGLRPDEWQLLHAGAELVDHDAADVLLFLVSTGWRWSECVAAQALAVDHWIDDEDQSHTYVTMGRVLRREGDRFVFVDDGKSEAADRRVRIRGAAEAMVLRRIEGKKPDALILTTGRGSRWDYTHYYNRVWKRPAKGDDAPGKKRIIEEAVKLGFTRPEVTFHWLRHTHVGMLILAGEPLTAIQRRLGHASIKTTSDTYGRMIEDASVGGLDRVAALIDGAPTARAVGPAVSRPEAPDV